MGTVFPPHDCFFPSCSYSDLSGIQLDDEMQIPAQWREDMMMMMGSNSSSSPDNCCSNGGLLEQGRRKRRRARAVKNKEEVENQRRTHIAVERNRRKQMNEYLAVLRDIMPHSYANRGDQASIVGGAINFVKELEHLLHSLETEKHNCNLPHPSPVFSDFFTFPQYTTTPTSPPSYHNPIIQTVPEKSNAVADVEVNMVDGHANIKVLSRKQPRHLLKMVVGMQSLGLSILHLNVTTFHQTVLYSFSVKVDDSSCEVSSVNEIAGGVYEMVERIQEES